MVLRCFVRSEPFSVLYRKVVAGAWDYTAISVTGRHSVAQKVLFFQLKDMCIFCKPDF